MIIGFAIFFVAWPYLWLDPIGRLANVIHFYKDIGSATGTADPRFIALFGINIYPIVYIVTTTPLVVLAFVIFGIIFTVKNFKKDKKALAVLALLWFAIPIARVTWHGANIYGGIRQIMEYVPALAILSGIGAYYLISNFKFLKFRIFKVIFIFCVFVALIIPIIQSHPNEDVYSNFLIGGLSGAKSKNMPFWGNTFGSPYRLALVWVNKNVPYGAKLDLVYE